ncbi:flagellar biosynthesis protein FlhF [Helicobacter monodelphidis]|uniref:flagellar biosynthesis protein FlhF n=1 Tax=Helicobacter sp. 15-1451 TaxID=2004995 RepID=UPI000DCD2DF2|nr:flagellar biosynthesis protein FlhF [Helicobacter sp. 15-1451]RAX58126.1 flagellar biosynthesis protein FlhF [Helicobacter sp. 15-1451]
MKVYTYQGESPTEALQIAQQKHGEEALVLQTKEVRKKTMTQPALYEVQVAIDEEAQPSMPPSLPPKKSNNASERLQEIAQKSLEAKRNAKKAPALTPVLGLGEESDDLLQLSDTVRQISELAGVPTSQKNHSLSNKLNKELSRPIVGQNMGNTEAESTKNEIKELKAIKAEIDKLNDKMKILGEMVWDKEGPKKEGLMIPQEFAEIYRLAKNSGIYRSHLDKIMQLTLELMPLKMRENSVFIKRYFREVLRKMVYCRPENLEVGSKKIIMLVGPTGVGKTTTLAKLAARYAFMMNKKYKVGIITLDTFRIGAVDQLMFYAKKMKLSIDTVVDPGEFVQAVDSLKYCDYILVDTVGSSQHDKQKIDLLKSFVNSDSNCAIDVSLVISATTKYEDLKDIYHTFSVLDIDTLVLTKLDETRGFGNVFSLVHETKKPLSYFSIGQEVPNDLVVASSEYLTDCLLDGFKKAE